MEEFGGLLLPIAFLALLWFMMIRPQQKRRKEQQAMVSNLAVGSDIVTIGGLHGRVVALADDTMDVAVDAEEDVIMRFERSSVGRVVKPEIADADEIEPLDDEPIAETADAADGADVDDQQTK